MHKPCPACQLHSLSSRASKPGYTMAEHHQRELVRIMREYLRPQCANPACRQTSAGQPFRIAAWSPGWSKGSRRSAAPQACTSTAYGHCLPGFPNLFLPACNGIANRMTCNLTHQMTCSSCAAAAVGSAQRTVQLSSRSSSRQR